MKQVAFVLVFLSTFIGNTQIDKSKYYEVDDKDLILKMHFTNEDLAESGHKIVSHMYLK